MAEKIINTDVATNVGSIDTEDDLNLISGRININPPPPDGSGARSPPGPRRRIGHQRGFREDGSRSGRGDLETHDGIGPLACCEPLDEIKGFGHGKHESLSVSAHAPECAIRREAGIGDQAVISAENIHDTIKRRPFVQGQRRRGRRVLGFASRHLMHNDPVGSRLGDHDNLSGGIVAGLVWTVFLNP